MDYSWFEDKSGFGRASVAQSDWVTEKTNKEDIDAGVAEAYVKEQRR